MDEFLTKFLWNGKPTDPFYLKQVKSLRAKILHLVESSGKKIIGVTSAVDGEGKTTVSMNIAASFSANRDDRVLLMDCDLIRTDVTNILGRGGNPGLSEYLRGNDDGKDHLFADSPQKNLFFVSSGNPVPNSSELLTKQVFANLLEVIRRKFDIVILDLPPVVSTPDPASLVNLVDVYILVYRAGETPRELFEHAVEEIGSENILGVIFNRVKKESIQKYKSKYYYYNNYKEVK